MVMPRSCSSSLLSRYRILPAMRAEMMLLEARSESAYEDFPWSTCPTMLSGSMTTNGEAVEHVTEAMVL